MRFIALDFETSGRSSERHAPVSIGMAVMDGEDVLAETEFMIGPTKHWKTGAIEREYDINALIISGTHWKDVLAAPHPKAVVEQIREFSAANDAMNLTIKAFNAPFDIAFFSLTLFLASDWHPTIKGVMVQPKPPLLGPWQCVLMRARHELSLPDYKLDTVASHFGLARSGEKHGALEDAILCGRIDSRMTAASGNSLDKGVGKQTGAAAMQGETQ